VDVREISLHDADGRELLSNRRFEQGGARWFFSSDRNHMPWHAKNLAVHLLFEQGYLGLAAMGLLAGLAWWRVALGRARQHPLAPALAAALLGFGVVGTVDSLLDVPRLAMLFWLLCGVALSLKPARRTLPSG
jgi:O-antigen ligase